MKKTILATAILLAGAANAAEVYNNEGTTVELGGSFRGHAVINNSDDVKFKDAGSRFDIKAVKELDNGLTAFGTAEIKNDSGDNKSLYLNLSYLGLAHDTYGTASLGKQWGLNDSLVMSDFSYEAGVYNEDNETLGSSANDQLKYSNSFGGATVVVSLMDQDTYAIGGTYEIADFEIGASYNIANDRDSEVRALADNSSLIVGARYSLDALTLGATFITTEVDYADTSSYGLGAHYKMGQAGAYIMYDILDGDAKSDEGSEFVLGADYEIAAGVRLYTEFTASDRDEGNTDGNVLKVGGRVYF